MPSNGVNYISGSLSRVKASKSTPDKPSRPIRHPRPLFPQPGPNTHSLGTPPADANQSSHRTEVGRLGEEETGTKKGSKKERSLAEFEFSWAKTAEADPGNVALQRGRAGKRSLELGVAGHNSRKGKRWWDDWTTNSESGNHGPPGGKENIRPTRDDVYKILARPDLAGTARSYRDHNSTGRDGSG